MPLKVPASVVLFDQHVSETGTYDNNDFDNPGTLTDVLPLSKPANPQLEWTTTETLQENSKSAIIAVTIVPTHPGDEAITIYAELVVNGVSQGVQSGTFSYYGGSFKWGDFDPFLTYDLQLYLWASGIIYIPTDYYFYFSFVVGTVGDKVVWEKTISPALLVFSNDGLVDTTHLYVDDEQVTDYDLWWDGSKISLKGTDFFIYEGLIYQEVTIQ